MKENPAVLLETKDIVIDGCHVPDLILREGESVMMFTEEISHGTYLMDILLGLQTPTTGSIQLLGQEPVNLTEDQRLMLLRDVAHVGHQGDLISNLKVWENICLPAQFHHKMSLESMEPILLEGAKIAGMDETWISEKFPVLPDNLHQFDQRLVMLLRASLLPARLLVCEFLFDNLPHSEDVKLANFIQWMKGRNPKLGVFYLHHAPFSERNLDLTILHQPSIFYLEGNSHEVS
jgi:predicted ABC-type transport system involved in lysophospholipase L1 biosynthesis ATPase subunit